MKDWPQVREEENPCAAADCSHLCMLGGRGARCSCPDHLSLAEDERTCYGGAATGGVKCFYEIKLKY